MCVMVANFGSPLLVVSDRFFKIKISLIFGVVFEMAVCAPDCC